MAKRERKTQKKQEKVEQKRSVMRKEPQTLFDRHAWEQGTPSIGETPFQPRVDEHAELIARATSDEHRANLVLQLQQTYGNRYVQRLLNSRVVQAKLNVSAPNDIYEQEADRVAKAVTKADSSQVQRQPEEEEILQGKALQVQRQAEEEEEPLQTKIQRQVEEEELQGKVQRQVEEEEEPLQTKLASEVQRQEEPEEEEEEEPVQTKLAPDTQRQEEEEELQGKAAGSQPAAVSDNLEARIKAERGGGHPLSDNTRAPMEQSFGADFSGVRVHTDSEANALNKQLSARAFTTGQDVFFRQGEYSPGSDSGRELIAHELTHVVQQTGGTKLQSKGQEVREVAQLEGISEGALQTRFAHPTADILQRNGEEGTVNVTTRPRRPRRPRRTRKPSQREVEKKVLNPENIKRVKSKIREKVDKLPGPSVPSESSIEKAKKQGEAKGKEIEPIVKNRPKVAAFAEKEMTGGKTVPSMDVKEQDEFAKLNTGAGRRENAGDASEWIGWIEQGSEIGLEAAGELGAKMSKAAADIAGNVLGAFGLFLSAISAFFDVRACWRATKRITYLEYVLEDARKRVGDPARFTEQKELIDFLKYAIQQKYKKWGKRFANLVGTLSSATVGLAALVAGVSLLALASNPVGWVIAAAIAGAGILVGLGLVVYKIGRAIYKKVMGTKGVVRREWATKLFKSAFHTKDPLGIDALESLGLKHEKLLKLYEKDKARARHAIIKRIEGKLKSA